MPGIFDTVFLHLFTSFGAFWHMPGIFDTVFLHLFTFWGLWGICQAFLTPLFKICHVQNARHLPAMFGITHGKDSLSQICQANA